MSRLPAVFLAAALAVAAPRAQDAIAPRPVAQTLASPTFVTHRVLTADGRLSSLEALAADAATADVLFLGERHDDVPTHRLELALLQAVAATPARVVLALEMFERDVQEPIEHLLMGHLSDAEFAAEARPWPEYSRDYKPLVDLAIVREWPVVAANVPRAIAAEVSRAGLDVLTSRPASERAWFARDIQCPTDDAYARRFREAMQQPSGGLAPADAAAGLDAQTMSRYYEAQCLKDETMAESIAQAHAVGSIGGGHPLVVSVNGAFHSDYGQGMVERTRRRLPTGRVITVSVVPVPDVGRASVAPSDPPRAEYVVFVER